MPPQDDLAHAYAVRYANRFITSAADRTANNGDFLVLSDSINSGATMTIPGFQWRSPGGAINGTLDLLACTTANLAD